jgi:prolyl-tRNA synthetase
LFNCEPGYISPINIENITVYADNELKYLKDGVCGANEEGYHYLHADVERDFPNVQFHDLREVVQGDSCPKCGGELVFAKGIEVGQVFKLGTKYSEKLNAKYLDENGKEQTMVMGCYGIGVSRTMAACVEQNYDEKGIIWPKSIAPYQVVVVCTGK